MSASARRRVAAGAMALAVLGGVSLFNEAVIGLEPAADGLLVLSATFAIGAVAVVGAEWPRSSAGVVPLAVAAAVVSTAATVVHEPRSVARDATWIVVEAMALLALVALVIRWAPARGAAVAGALAIVAEALSALRVTPASWSLESLGAFLTWTFGGAGAAAFGVYLRAVDARRDRMVLDARRAQRLELARDLHDFVAHDVTGIVVQAQGAHLVARRDPAEATAALARIEEAGLRALGSLDRTVRVLGDAATPGTRPGGGRAVAAGERATGQGAFGLEDVFALVGRFAATDRTPVRLHVDTAGAPRIPAEVASAAYRVVLEALTNVRRHAPAAPRVDVGVDFGECASGAALVVRVANEPGAPGTARAGVPRDAHVGGRGLAGLTECVERVGGTMAAGALDSGGWHVTAVLPIATVARP